MGLFKCRSCEYLKDELKLERQRSRDTLDQVLAMANRPDAMTQSVTQPYEPPTPTPTEAEMIEADEAARVRLDEVAREELEKFAEASGQDVADFADVP